MNETEAFKKIFNSKPTRCILCLKKAAYKCAFFPTATFAKKLGTPLGKDRIIGYGLCKKCEKKSDNVIQVEAIILKQCQAALKKPDAN